VHTIKISIILRRTLNIETVANTSAIIGAFASIDFFIIITAYRATYIVADELPRLQVRHLELTRSS